MHPTWSPSSVPALPSSTASSSNEPPTKINNKEGNKQPETPPSTGLDYSSGKSSKYYKDVGESIAKSLPSLVKGTMSAADAFKKGDYISGSAALMDICASVIPVFASLFDAGGPAGAVVGALFSVIGQILSYFAPKQPSLEDKIQKMLDHMQSESEIQSITAFGYSVASYTKTLRDKSAGVHTMG